MRWLVLLLIFLVTGAPARAQDLATLVADRIEISARSVLTASGKVEVFFGATRLRAESITYDRSTNRLIITGPITLTDASGAVLTAEQADLSTDLQQGILKGARLVLDQQLQLAAAQINRVGGRYTQLSRVVVSSCQVCAAHPVPVWELRAVRVVHDQQERQLYFDKVTFRAVGVPIFYFPRLRMPDPTVKRATGFMMPRVRTTSTLGTGVKLPYFIRLGDSKDLTLTPYLATNATQTLDLRFRQALRYGSVEVNGAVSSDTLIQGTLRGYLIGRADLGFGDGYRLQVDVQSVSDAAYLFDYAKGSTDRLRNAVTLSRTDAARYFNGQLLHITSIRQGEDNATLPSLIGEVTYARRFRPALVGGEARLQFQTYSLHRDSQADQAGRDTARASLRGDWRRTWILPSGIAASLQTALTADLYRINQDRTFQATFARITPDAALELRWPWSRTTPDGPAVVIEPIAQLVFSPTAGIAVPNEDSVLVEFDEGNLFSLSRFPGSDLTERGPRANFGLTWTRYDPAGWVAGATLGRTVRLHDLGQFSAGSGLAGRRSDWLVAAQLKSGHLSLTDRALLDEDLSVSKNELRLTLYRDRLSLATSHLWLVAEPAENRAVATSEWALNASYALDNGWTGKINWLYDHTAGRAFSAGLGLQYRGDCVNLDMSVSRRFASSSNVTSTTDFGLSVDLAGLNGAAKTGVSRRSCR